MKGHVLAVLLLAVAAAPGEIEATRLAGGFAFVEGPAEDGKGSVYFTDIPNQRIHRMDAAGRVTVFVEKSGRANGLMFNGKGELVACEGGTGRVVAIAPDGTPRVLTDSFGGARYNAPNDLVIDRSGGVYFTDPYFGRPRVLPQRTMGVYYVPAKGGPRRIVESLPHPNGIILAPDEKTLYVVCTGDAGIRAYPVEAPGKIGKERIFARLRRPEGNRGATGDGLTVDTEGVLYVTSRMGIQVFSPDGTAKGILAVPETPANVTFREGGLFVTARTSVYALPVDAKGHVFPAGR